MHWATRDEIEETARESREEHGEDGECFYEDDDEFLEEESLRRAE